MSKYLINGFALIRGTIIKTLSFFYKQQKIGNNIRVFLSASLNLDKGSNVTFNSGLKIRERALVSVRKGATLNIGKNVSIGMDNKIVVHEKVEIGEGTLLSPNVLVYDHDHVFDVNTGVYRKDFKTKPIIIGKNCWIGANTVILKDTVIGDNSVVGAGCVLSGEYPAYSIIIQKRETTIREINYSNI